MIYRACQLQIYTFPYLQVRKVLQSTYEFYLEVLKHVNIEYDFRYEWCNKKCNYDTHNKLTHTTNRHKSHLYTKTYYTFTLALSFNINNAANKTLKEQNIANNIFDKKFWKLKQK